ncbi:MAG: hypothetical protein EXS05_18820 [Planctomycetaceae bacterium]|nr:hypothetical protein [Planctomycetaceae bacterium]
MTRSVTAFFTTALCLTALLAGGCLKFAPKDEAAKAEPPKAEAKPAGNSVLGKTTQEIGKFDPNADQEISDQKIHATDPFTAGLSAYRPGMEKVSIIGVDHAMGLYNATEGRYPKDYEEFMEKIIKANNIQLPVLPYGYKYMYDEKEHTLLSVKPAAAPPDQNQKTDQKKN